MLGNLWLGFSIPARRYDFPSIIVWNNCNRCSLETIIDNRKPLPKNPQKIGARNLGPNHAKLSTQSPGSVPSDQINWRGMHSGEPDKNLPLAEVNKTLLFVYFLISELEKLW
jgi:hypothetical protein